MLCLLNMKNYNHIVKSKSSPKIESNRSITRLDSLPEMRLQINNTKIFNYFPENNWILMYDKDGLSDQINHLNMYIRLVHLKYGLKKSKNYIAISYYTLDLLTYAGVYSYIYRKLPYRQSLEFLHWSQTLKANNSFRSGYPNN